MCSSGNSSGEKEKGSQGKVKEGEPTNRNRESCNDGWEDEGDKKSGRVNKLNEQKVWCGENKDEGALMELMESGKVSRKEIGKMMMEPEKPKNGDLNGNNETLTGINCVQKKKFNETDRKNELANGKDVEQVQWNAIHDEPLNPMERNMKTGTDGKGSKSTDITNAYKYGKLKGMIIGSNNEERITCSSAMEFDVKQGLSTPKGVPLAHMLSGFGSIEKRPFKLDINYTNPGKESIGEVLQDHFFEGAEKLLEIWFTTLSGYRGISDLRDIPRTALEKLLGTVNCEIISSRHNSEIDAYLLSESSMFVSKRRFILKTCGTTTTLHCLDELFRLVQQYTEFDAVQNVFYSRKNFERPDLQKCPHRHFEQEAQILDKYFQEGKGYCMGSLNKNDCWYLYTLNSCNRFVENRGEEPDQTIEILMSELNPQVMSIFTEKSSKNGRDCTKKSGIDKLVPRLEIDDYLFSPCGYSMNGILDTDSGGREEYVTIHITPEQEFSYVSFETNISQGSYTDLVNRVLSTFCPGKFIITIFSTKNSVAAEFHSELKISAKFKTWRRQDVQTCSLQSGEVTYANFAKSPS